MPSLAHAQREPDSDGKCHTRPRERVCDRKCGYLLQHKSIVCRSEIFEESGDDNHKTH